MLNIFRHIKRMGTHTLAVVFLAAALSACICGLVKAGQMQQKQFEETYDSIPVTLRVTNLSATRWDNLECPIWVMQAFTGQGFAKDETSLAEYVKAVDYKMSINIDQYGASIDGKSVEGVSTLTGITCTGICEELNQKKAAIRWLDGWDESMFGEYAEACIVSKSIMPDDWDGRSPATLTISVSYSDGWSGSYTAVHELKIAGFHTASPEKVYTGYSMMARIYSSVNKSISLDAVSATLADNDSREEVRQAAFIRFAEPNATGEHTSWKWAQYFWYPYALDIDDSLLVDAELTLKTSLLLGEICSYIMFALSAGAGFFVGFLMIRSRRREIALKRSMGQGSISVFADLAAEQLTCLVLGTVIGGAAFLWQPVERIAVFMLVYTIGLSIALAVFLRRNLMTALKEED